jgi:Mg2+ and Co2+ transporter CorA
MPCKNCIKAREQREELTQLRKEVVRLRMSLAAIRDSIHSLLTNVQV